jgi:hypothetical protein
MGSYDAGKVGGGKGIGEAERVRRCEGEKPRKE